MVVCQFLGDLIAGVTTPDDDDPSRRQVARSPVPGAVRLIDVRGDRRGERGNPRLLERAGGDNDLVGEDRPRW